MFPILSAESKWRRRDEHFNGPWALVDRLAGCSDTSRPPVSVLLHVRGRGGQVQKQLYGVRLAIRHWVTEQRGMSGREIHCAIVALVC